MLGHCFVDFLPIILSVSILTLSRTVAFEGSQTQALARPKLTPSYLHPKEGTPFHLNGPSSVKMLIEANYLLMVQSRVKDNLSSVENTIRKRNCKQIVETPLYIHTYISLDVSPNQIYSSYGVTQLKALQKVEEKGVFVFDSGKEC